MQNKLLIRHPGVVDAEKFPSVRKISIYPGYERENSSDDFAILTLAEPIVDRSKSKIPSVIDWIEEVITESYNHSEELGIVYRIYHLTKKNE